MCLKSNEYELICLHFVTIILNYIKQLILLSEHLRLYLNKLLYYEQRIGIKLPFYCIKYH